MRIPITHKPLEILLPSPHATRPAWLHDNAGICSWNSTGIAQHFSMPLARQATLRVDGCHYNQSGCHYCPESVSKLRKPTCLPSLPSSVMLLREPLLCHGAWGLGEVVRTGDCAEAVSPMPWTAICKQETSRPIPHPLASMSCCNISELEINRLPQLAQRGLLHRQQ